MNKNKLSNPVRLIAFFLTAVVLICTFGFTADGWQIDNNENNDSIGMFPTPPNNDDGDISVNDTHTGRQHSKS